MSKRKILSLVLAVALLASLLQSISMAATTTTTTSKIPATKSYTDIKVLTYQNQGVNEDSEAFQKFNSLLGGNKIQVTQIINTQYVTKLMLGLASDDLPDIFTTFGDIGIKTNAAARFTLKELQTYAPDYYKVFLSNAKAFKMDPNVVMKRWTIDGKLMGFDLGNRNALLPVATNVIRKDILDEFKLPIPKTLEDWENFMKVYKAKYPNKYPLSARGKDAVQANLRLVMLAHGITMDWWSLTKGKKLEFGPFSPETPKALEVMRRWYKAGYLNPEYLTMDSNAYQAEFVNGNSVALYMSTGISNIISAPFEPGSIYERTYQKDNKARFAWAPSPVLKKGDKPYNIGASTYTNDHMIFGKHLEKNKDRLYSIFKMINKMSTNEELYRLSQFGIEDKTYTTAKGYPERKAEFNTADGKVKGGVNWYYGIWGVDNNISNKYRSPALNNVIKKEVESPIGTYSKYKTIYLQDRRTGNLVNKDGEDYIQKNKMKLDAFYKVFNEVIVGSKTISDYNEYIADWKKEYGNDMTKTANELYLDQWIK